MTKSHIITTKTKGEVDMSSVYRSEITEEQIKRACLDFVETYPKVEKQIREGVEYIEKEFKCFEDCINSEQYADAEKYNLSEATLVIFRKQVKKAFKPYTNTVKSFLEVTKNESYATQDYYLELKKLNKKAIETRREVLKTINYYKDMYLLYQLQLGSKVRILNFEDIAKKTIH